MKNRMDSLTKKSTKKLNIEMGENSTYELSNDNLTMLFGDPMIMIQNRQSSYKFQNTWKKLHRFISVEQKCVT